MSSDPYVYPGTTVLKNIPGIRNQEILGRFEGDRVGQRSLELLDCPLFGLCLAKTQVVLSFTPITMLQASAQAVDFKVGRYFGEGHRLIPNQRRVAKTSGFPHPLCIQVHRAGFPSGENLGARG